MPIAIATTDRERIRRRDALYNEYNRLTNDLKAINPALSIHGRLKAKMEMVKAEIKILESI